MCPPASPALPLTQDVQLLFDLELRGPPGGASNLLPWTPANEAIVAEVLCRGYLPAANPAEVTVEVINAFTVRWGHPALQAQREHRQFARLGSTAHRLCQPSLLWWLGRHCACVAVATWLPNRPLPRPCTCLSFFAPAVPGAGPCPSRGGTQQQPAPSASGCAASAAASGATTAARAAAACRCTAARC